MLVITLLTCSVLMIICGIVALVRPERLVSRVNRSNPDAVRKSRANAGIYFVIAICCAVPVVKDLFF